MSNLWCSELLDESPSTSRHSLGTYGSNNPSSSGWVSAERRRLHGMSLMDNSSTVHHPSRPLQNSASFRRVQTGVLAQSRRSLEFSIDNRNSNENRPSQYYNMSASTNDVTNSGTWRKNSARVLTSIDTNARAFNAAQPVYQVDSSSSGISHPLSIQRSAARKRRLTADHQLNVAQRLWVASDVDKTVHLDSRTLTALLRAEQYTLPNADHYKSLQREINENVRRSAVVFISDICNRENADLVVFPLAVSYIDRVLSVQFVPRHNLLALANACLLLASKMKAPRPLTPQQIVEHTDNWVTQDELLDWELFIVNKLGWQLSTATAYEFFDQLMVRAPILETLRESFAQTLATMLKEFSATFPYRFSTNNRKDGQKVYHYFLFLTIPQQ
ncbi:G1/S-specific cyclin-D1 [Ditylenchus destructor]|uniref:G1/S-specific cyclin-D1 n=1 Tax=Ditylenchus destructor TaxID=166010 RepID=A0AAD4ND59_9BILA|nr:G1/S-specific cyclin-D1 [Ditylenchus destructor]